jgi:hypothetical protein
MSADIQQFGCRATEEMVMTKIEKAINDAQTELVTQWCARNERVPSIDSDDMLEKGWGLWLEMEKALSEKEELIFNEDGDEIISNAMTVALCEWIKNHEGKMPKKSSGDLIEKGLAFWREEKCKAKKRQTLKITKEDHEEIQENLMHYKDLLLKAMHTGEDKPRIDTLMGKAFFLLTTKHVVIKYVDSY